MAATASKEVIVQKALEIVRQYAGHGRMTLRQLYYQLVAKLVIPNTVSQYKRLSALLVEAREEGAFPWDALEDRTRVILGAPSTGDGDEASRVVDGLIYYIQNSQGPTMPRWWGQKAYVEVWLEKQALEGVVQAVTGPLEVVLMPGKGYSSATFLKQAADRLREVRREHPDRSIHILYCGDFDPSGLDIERYAEEKMQAHGVDYDTFGRLCLTRDQIDEYSLPPMPVKDSDSRAAAFRVAEGDEVVELDALPLDVFQTLIREAIEAHFSRDLFLKRREALIERRVEYKALLKDALVQMMDNWEDDEDQDDEDSEDEDQEGA